MYNDKKSTTATGKIERVFKSGDKVYITVVLKNPADKKVSERLEISITDDNGKEIDKIVSKNINIKSKEIKNFNFTWESRDYAKQNLSGFEFIGRKFFVKAEFGNSIQTHGFYIDEFGVPEWLRRNVELHLGDQFRDVIDNAKNKEEVLEYYRKMMEYANSTGFTSVLFHHYYSYGYHESHQPSGINYWFPAGENQDTHYSTPYSNLIKLAGSEDEAQKLIRELVNIAHDNNLRVIAYIDPIGIYDPKLLTQTADYTDGVVLHGYPFVATAHHNSTSLGYAALNENGDPIRANFLEVKWFISTVDDFAYQVSPCGPSKKGLANNEIGFSPDKISADLNSNWREDPSHHYQTVKEVNWLMKNYGFDGISTDDTGRLIMASGPANYWDDAWTLLMHPEKPTKSLYGISDDKYCVELRGNQDKDNFSMDSFANMIKHIRWQIKDNNSDKILISNDYFVPSDVDWSSIIASEDVSASDQFNIMKPSFVRWAYLNYNDGYKTLRNDLRRTLQPVPLTDVKLDPLNPIDYSAMMNRKDKVRAVLLATSWANKVHSEILLDELKKTPETKRLLENYIDMRKRVNLPIYNETSQELIYHLNLKPEFGFRDNKYVEVCPNPIMITQNTTNPCLETPPYVVAYRISSEYGENALVLHVINLRAISGLSDSAVPFDYSFRIRIPSLEEVQGVYLVSADINPITNKTRYTNYVENITSETDKWYISNNYLHLKLPQVITSTIAYIEFKPENLTGNINQNT